MEDKTIIHPVTNKEIAAAFDYGDFLFYFDKSEIDDTKSTVAENKATGEIITGKDANNLLIENVDAYCHQSGQVWMTHEFKPVIRLHQRNI